MSRGTRPESHLMGEEGGSRVDVEEGLGGGRQDHQGQR